MFRLIDWNCVRLWSQPFLGLFQIACVPERLVVDLLAGCSDLRKDITDDDVRQVEAVLYGRSTELEPEISVEGTNVTGIDFENADIFELIDFVGQGTQIVVNDEAENRITDQQEKSVTEIGGVQKEKAGTLQETTELNVSTVYELSGIQVDLITVGIFMHLTFLRLFFNEFFKKGERIFLIGDENAVQDQQWGTNLRLFAYLATVLTAELSSTLSVAIIFCIGLIGVNAHIV